MRFHGVAASSTQGVAASSTGGSYLLEREEEERVRAARVFVHRCGGVALARLFIHRCGEDDRRHLVVGKKCENFTLRRIGQIETGQCQREIMGAQQDIGLRHGVTMDHFGCRFLRKPRLQQHGKSNGIFNQKDFILHAV